MGNEGWSGSSYEPSYAYQQPSGSDDYGNPTYTSYTIKIRLEETIMAILLMIDIK